MQAVAVRPGSSLPPRLPPLPPLPLGPSGPVKSAKGQVWTRLDSDLSRHVSVCTTSPALRCSGFNPFSARRTSYLNTCLYVYDHPSAVGFSGFNPFPAIRTSYHDTCLHHLPLPALRFSTHSALTLSLPLRRYTCLHDLEGNSIEM